VKKTAKPADRSIGLGKARPTPQDGGFPARRVGAISSEQGICGPPAPSKDSSRVTWGPKSNAPTIGLTPARLRHIRQAGATVHDGAVSVAPCTRTTVMPATRTIRSNAYGIGESRRTPAPPIGRSVAAELEPYYDQGPALRIGGFRHGPGKISRAAKIEGGPIS